MADAGDLVTAASAALGERDQAYSDWQQVWQKMVRLKKRHKPQFVPVEIWLPLEAECKAAFARCQASSAVARHAQMAASAALQPSNA